MRKDKLVSVKTYHLAGGGVTIRFSREDPYELELEYEDKEIHKTFSGRAIHRNETRIGFIATVELKADADRHTIAFSVVIPDANRPENAKSIDVTTFGVRTTSRTSIGGPGLVEGQIQTYETLALEGNAW